MIECTVKVILSRILNRWIDQCGDRIHESEHLLPDFLVVINPESEQVSLKEVFVTALKHVLESSHEVRGTRAWV
jgi:hypothetical protein